MAATEQNAQPFIEARSETHRAMGRNELRDRVLDGDVEAAFELERRRRNRERRRSRKGGEL